MCVLMTFLMRSFRFLATNTISSFLEGVLEADLLALLSSGLPQSVSIGLTRSTVSIAVFESFKAGFVEDLSEEQKDSSVGTISDVPLESRRNAGFLCAVGSEISLANERRLMLGIFPKGIP